MVACGEYNFVQLLKEIGSRHQNVEFLIVGPTDSGEWTQLKSQSNGRIRAVGIQEDLRPYLSAADVYLDSIPLSSSTEALEAGALGIPVVGLATELAIQLSSDIAPDSIKTHFDNRDELFSVIDKLVSDEVYRRNHGDCLQAAILRNHCSGWIEHLNLLYTLAPNTHILSEILATEKQTPDRSDVIWAYFQQRSGLSRSSFI